MTSGGKESSHFGVRNVLSKNTSNEHGLLVCYVAGTILSAPLRLIYWIFTTAFEGGTVTTSLCRRELCREVRQCARSHTAASGKASPRPRQPCFQHTRFHPHVTPTLSPPPQEGMYIKYSALDFCKVLGRSFIKGFLKASWQQSVLLHTLLRNWEINDLV